jgi:hypothetical protein
VIWCTLLKWQFRSNKKSFLAYIYCVCSLEMYTKVRSIFLYGLLSLCDQRMKSFEIDLCSDWTLTGLVYNCNC